MYSGLSHLALAIVRDLFSPPYDGEVTIGLAHVVDELVVAGVVNREPASRGKTIRVTLTLAARDAGPPA